MPRASERAARGRLIAQGTACWRACAERCEARKARIERLFVGREKNLCELTRADPSGDDKDDRHCGMKRRAIHALRRPAFEKRQGTKSREVGLGRPCRWLSYGDLSGEHAACERASGER